MVLVGGIGIGFGDYCLVGRGVGLGSVGAGRWFGRGIVESCEFNI